MSILITVVLFFVILFYILINRQSREREAKKRKLDYENAIRSNSIRVLILHFLNSSFPVEDAVERWKKRNNRNLKEDVQGLKNELDYLEKQSDYLKILKRAENCAKAIALQLDITRKTNLGEWLKRNGEHYLKSKVKEGVKFPIPLIIYKVIPPGIDEIRMTLLEMESRGEEIGLYKCLNFLDYIPDNFAEEFEKWKSNKVSMLSNLNVSFDLDEEDFLADLVYETEPNFYDFKSKLNANGLSIEFFDNKHFFIKINE